MNSLDSAPRATRAWGVAAWIGSILCTVFLVMIAMVSAQGTAQATHAVIAPAVTLDQGTLAGIRFGGSPENAAFLGIPYTAQPVGNLRWRPPEPAPTWKGVRNATQFGPACPQTPGGWWPEMLGRKQLVTNEACLYLNVWTTNLSGAQKVPVMVWIHGGGNVEGSGEIPPLGPALAEQGVVVVSLNYRLGAFGFFAYPALSAESRQHVSGNYGLMDQVAAIQWVRRNIRRFGGDPSQITVFGASSGSLDICNLMASPQAAGLFQQAILQSGVCVDSVFPTLRQAEANDDRLASDLGIQQASNGALALAALRKLPAELILQAAAHDPEIDLEPAVDGWFFREQPAVTFTQGRQVKIPVMVGSNADEISIFASPIVGGTSYRPKTVAEYRQWLRQRFHGFAEQMFAAYPARTDSEVPAVFRRMDTDFDFGYGARLMAREMARIEPSTYLYRFTYVGAGEFAPLGAFHMEPSMFLSKIYWPGWVRRPYDATLSRILIGYWIRFAKTGNPNGAGLPAWSAYNPKTDECQELGVRIGPERVPRADRFAVFDADLAFRLKKAEP
ncbi:MAG: carboxylesterase family protein [Acidobacteriaceae bacterium]